MTPERLAEIERTHREIVDHVRQRLDKAEAVVQAAEAFVYGHTADYATILEHLTKTLAAYRERA